MLRRATCGLCLRGSLCEDIRPEEKPVIDMERLHGIAQVRIGASSLKEEHQFGLVEPHVVHIFEWILDMLARHLVKEVVLSLFQ